ncbi:unnamed protein product [Schistosoma spindalis]|nr:unnamed protein product [Schistosoma spindale]
MRSCKFIQVIMFLLFIRLDIFNSTIYSLSLNYISSTLLLLCSSTTSSSSSSSSLTSNVFGPSKHKALSSISLNTSNDLSYQSSINKINNNNDKKKNKNNTTTNNTTNNTKNNKNKNKKRNQDISLKTFNKQITYTLIEESNIPQFIGNLINDFQLTNYLLNYILNDSSWNNNHNNNNLRMNTINQSKQLLSIDLIANQYQIINNNYNNTDHHHYYYNNNNELPRLYLFPSNQWSSKYFHINYYNLFKQELIQIKKLDRDQLCHWYHDHDYDHDHHHNHLLKEINTCFCFLNTCTIINNQSNLNQLNLPYCQFTITIAMNLLKIGIEIMTIHIKLIDINDNYPIFQLFNKYEINFMEDDLIGTRYQLPIAIDYDMCFYSNITYQLQWIDSMKYHSFINSNQLINNQSINDFSLIFNKINNHDILEIQLDHHLDREKINKYELNLLAIDNYYQLNDIKHTTTLPLIIYIQDVNDCKPEFTLINNNNNNNHSSNEVLYQSNDPLLIEVCEDAPIGYVITKFHAIDKDIGKNAEIQYRISQYTHSITKSFFRLNSTTGELIVQESLDREKSPLSNDLHHLIITAYDQGIPQRSSNLFILIKILDINDNFPMIHLMDETDTFEKSKFKQSPWYQNIQSNNNNNNNNNMIQINNQLINKMWQFLNDNHYNKSININSIINQLNNHSIHTKMIGNQPINTIINFLIINDPDLNENGTVYCDIKNQLLIYSFKYYDQNNSTHYNYNINNKQQFILLEPFYFLNQLNDQEKNKKINEKNKKIQFNSLINEKMIRKTKEQNKTGRKQDRRPVTSTTTTTTNNNNNNSNIDSFLNHNNYQLRTNMVFDPDKITDLYLHIECSDYGLPSLTTIQTIHFEIIQPFNNIHSLLNISHIQIINKLIINDINCNYFNYILQKNSNRKSIFSYYDHLSLSQLIYPTILHNVYMEAKSSICLILMKGIKANQQLFSIIVKTNYETNDNYQIIYELIKEIPNDHYFTIDSTTGIVSLIKELNQYRNTITKQLIIQASKIGTLYDYSKDLNYKIQILINLTLNFNDYSNDLIKDYDHNDQDHPDHDHPDHDQTIIYLQMNYSNSYIKTYTNDTYEFYITDSIHSGNSILSNIIIYCINYSSSIDIHNDPDHNCELTLKEIDSSMIIDEQVSKDFILKPIKFLCNNNMNYRSDLLCNGYTININHFIQHKLKNQYILMITPSFIIKKFSKKNSLKSIKIILYIKNQYHQYHQYNQYIPESFYLIKSIYEPFNTIFNKIGLKSPYCITNLSISYKVLKDDVIIKLNQGHIMQHRNKLIYILRHIWLLPKLHLIDSSSSSSSDVEKEIKDHLKLWNDKPFLTLNPYTGILSVNRQLLLMDVGEYILHIDIQDYSQPELFNKTCIILLNILPMELHQRPINDLPDSISSYNPISMSSSYSTSSSSSLSSSSLSSSSSVHSPVNSSTSIDLYNHNVYNLPEQNTNHFFKFSLGNNEFIKTNKHLLLPMILITIVIIFIIIIIIIMIIIYRIKFKSKLINKYKSNVNIIMDEQNQLLCLTSNYNEEILLKPMNSSSNHNSSSNNNNNNSNNSNSSINISRNSIYSHNEINHHYHSNDIIPLNNCLPITTNLYYTNVLYNDNIRNSTNSQVGYNMIHGNEPVYTWMNIIEDDQQLPNIDYTFTNHSVVNNFYKNYEDDTQQITLTETRSNM